MASCCVGIIVLLTILVDEVDWKNHIFEVQDVKINANANLSNMTHVLCQLFLMRKNGICQSLQRSSQFFVIFDGNSFYLTFEEFKRLFLRM